MGNVHAYVINEEGPQSNNASRPAGQDVKHMHAQHTQATLMSSDTLAAYLRLRGGKLRGVSLLSTQDDDIFAHHTINGVEKNSSEEGMLWRNEHSLPKQI